MSDKVRSVVQMGQVEAAGVRDEHLRKRLNDAIGDDENAVVLAVSAQLPIPDRIERFIVSPPELDQLERWLRAKMEEARTRNDGTSPTSSQRRSPVRTVILRRPLDPQLTLGVRGDA